MQDRPAWFCGLVYCEVFLQLPFFFLALYAFVRGLNWVRIPALCYGAHTATTLAAIFADMLLGGPPVKWRLVAIYSPFLIMPLAILLRMAFKRVPFEPALRKKLA